MAKDLFVVSISTVASESAFSTGGRVLDSFRSSLTPQTVEALICSEDWLPSSRLPLEDENLDELEDLDSAFQTSVLDANITSATTGAGSAAARAGSAAAGAGNADTGAGSATVAGVRASSSIAPSGGEDSNDGERQTEDGSTSEDEDSEETTSE
ncbi:unnamed protein product [Linum trigynum]|uniref:HAT C-terminal dimerisation domain-containing protein n=1 Tax=Linum trigynum TaxID=586398 RepID=A0AAV2FPV6_9ROSI